MKSWRRFLPSPAMLVALIALFVAMGGSTYAVTKINASKVNGLKAVKSTASLKKAKGKLVATQKKGSEKGQFNKKFIPKVNNAADADTLGGKTAAQLFTSATCKTGTVQSPISTVCIETNSRAAVTGKTAFQNCVNEGGFLPSALDLYASVLKSKITIDAEVWSGTLVNDGSAVAGQLGAITVTSGGPSDNPFDWDGATTQPYFCAFLPS